MKKFKNLSPVQQRLDSMYRTYLSNILSDITIQKGITDFTYSSPMLLDLMVKNGGLSDSKYTLMLVGQQTKVWFNRSERGTLKVHPSADYIEGLKNTYLEFNYGDRLLGKKYNGFFWPFQRLLMTEIESKIGGVGVISSNILRMAEKGDKIADPAIIEKVSYDNNYILREEINIIKPDIVVFATGPYYDRFLNRAFSDLSYSPSGNPKLSLRKLARLESKLLPFLSYRTYHPKPLSFNKYLKPSKLDIISTIANEIAQELSK